MFVKYALANRLYGHLLDIIDYDNVTKELIYLDSRSGKHYLKLGIKGFYNIDQSKIVHQIVCFLLLLSIVILALG